MMFKKNPTKRFPWESAYTGLEVTQPCCPEVARNQIHVTADISFAVRNHFAATNDFQWLHREGCPLAEEIGNFWKSRVVYNKSTHFYDIRGWYLWSIDLFDRFV